jgi:hypothetical protein
MAGVSTLEDLIKVGPKELLQVSGFGRKCLTELVTILEVVVGCMDHTELSRVSTQIRAWQPLFENSDVISIIRDLPTERSSRVIAPPFDPAQCSFSSLPLTNVPLSTRTQNILIQMDVKDLHHLAMINPRKLLSLTNCGRRTIGELSVLVADYLALLPASAEDFYSGTFSEWLNQSRTNGARFVTTVVGHTKRESYSRGALARSGQATLLEILTEFLRGLDPRHRNVLVSRMGLFQNHNRRTLDAVGREFHLTRERIRQIVQASIERCSRVVKIDRPDVFPFLRQYFKKTGIATLREVVDELKGIGSSTEYDAVPFVRMLLLAMPNDVQPLDSAELLWSGDKEGFSKCYFEVLKTAKRLLMGIPQRLDQLAVEVARSLNRLDDEDIDYIKKMLRTPSSQLRVESSEYGEMVHPPHQNTTDRRKSFLHGYIKEQGVPVHAQELFSAMQDSEPDLLPDSPTRLSAVSTMTALLAREPMFAWAGNGTWGLTEWGYLTQEMSVRAVVLELLRASSAPMTLREIADALSHLYRISTAAIRVVLKKNEGNVFRRDASGRWVAIA